MPTSTPTRPRSDPRSPQHHTVYATHIHFGHRTNDQRQDPRTYQARTPYHSLPMDPAANIHRCVALFLGDTGRYDAQLFSNISIQGFVWDASTMAQILADGQRLGIDLAAREARCEVVLDATIDCWATQTKPYLRIHSLNTIGMKGLKHQQREAAIARVETDGDLQRNKEHRAKNSTCCYSNR